MRGVTRSEWRPLLNLELPAEAADVLSLSQDNDDVLVAELKICLWRNIHLISRPFYGQHQKSEAVMELTVADGLPNER